MAIYLGNLSIKEIEKRAGFEFPKELVDFMKPRRQQEASNIAVDRWHCFDIPFVLECGDLETAKKIYSYLQPFSGQFTSIPWPFLLLSQGPHGSGF